LIWAASRNFRPAKFYKRNIAAGKLDL
jgi:hypothetical protein